MPKPNPLGYTNQKDSSSIPRLGRLPVGMPYKLSSLYLPYRQRKVVINYLIPNTAVAILAPYLTFSLSTQQVLVAVYSRFTRISVTQQPARNKVLVGIIYYNADAIYPLGYNRFFRVAIIDLYGFYIYQLAFNKVIYSYRIANNAFFFNKNNYKT